MEKLLDIIYDTFPGSDLFEIELSVLDGNGDPFDLFKGSPNSLSKLHIEKALSEPCRFYFLTLVGVDKEYFQEVDLHPDYVIRREITWLTDPGPPVIIDRKPMRLCFEWPSVKFVGAKPRNSISSVIYSIEMAEGQKFIGGPQSRSITDITASSEYINVISGHNMLSADINDLKPLTWYHIRLAIYCCGNYYRSKSISIYTPSAPPCAPKAPNAYLSPSLSLFDNSENKLLIRWIPPYDNGINIDLYQVQIQQIDSTGCAVLGDKKNNSSSKNKTKLVHNDLFLFQRKNSLRVRPKSPSSSTDDQGQDGQCENVEENNISNHAVTVSSYSVWKTVYANGDNKFYLHKPGDHGVVECYVRVRAKNSVGWSAYSEVLILNARSFPSLFSAGFLQVASAAATLAPVAPAPSHRHRHKHAMAIESANKNKAGTS